MLMRPVKKLGVFSKEGIELLPVAQSRTLAAAVL